MNNRLEVSYDLTPADLYAFQLRALNLSPIARRTRRNSYLTLFLTFFAIASLSAINSEGVGQVVISYGLVIVGFPVAAGIFRMIDKRHTHNTLVRLTREEQPDKGLVGTHNLVLGPDGIIESTVVGESRVSWNGVDRIEDDSDHIFIYTTPHAAHIVPRRAFADAKDASRFLEFARANHKRGASHAGAGRSVI